MKLATKNVYIYYDFPIIFSASDEEGNIFICLFADETASHFKYFCKQVSPTVLTALELNQEDVKSFFETPGKLYVLCLNAQSTEPVEAFETSEDIGPFLPEKDLFIGEQEVEIFQSTAVPELFPIPQDNADFTFFDVLLDYDNFTVNVIRSLSYYNESAPPHFQTDQKAVFSGDSQCLTNAA